MILWKKSDFGNCKRYFTLLNNLKTGKKTIYFWPHVIYPSGSYSLTRTNIVSTYWIPPPKVSEDGKKQILGILILSALPTNPSIDGCCSYILFIILSFYYWNKTITCVVRIISKFNVSIIMSSGDRTVPIEIISTYSSTIWWIVLKISHQPTLCSRQKAVYLG